MTFIFEFLRDPRKTGAVVQSSRALAKAMVESIAFPNAMVIVELGPGEGSITRELLSRMRLDSKLYVIENNPVFCALLRKITDPRLQVIEGKAEDLRKYVHSADYVVSSLPLLNFSVRTREITLRRIRSITTKSYIQFNYSTLIERVLRSHFPMFSRQLVLLNFPPAFVYTCKNL